MKTTVKIETERLIDAVKNNKEIYVICPECDRGSMEYGYNGTPFWNCLWRDCNDFFDIPSIQEIQDLIHLKTQLKQIKDWKI
jgi:hypothetical protein